MSTAVPVKLVSQLLATNADLRDLVEEFVDGLPARLCELREALEQLDWLRLTALIHRLKGAAGSYGYPDISTLAAEMESAFRAHQTGPFVDWAAQLERLIAAAQAGLEEG